jgi:hypothetical protein
MVAVGVAVASLGEQMHAPAAECRPNRECHRAFAADLAAPRARERLPRRRAEKDGSFL